MQLHMARINFKFADGFDDSYKHKQQQQDDDQLAFQYYVSFVSGEARSVNDLHPLYLAQYGNRMPWEVWPEKFGHLKPANTGNLTNEQEADKLASQVVNGQTVDPIVANKNNTSAEQKTPPGFENKVQNQKSGGENLPDQLREEMESKLGADFSGVKIHNTTNDHALAAEAGAQAFTQGQDIVFGKGKYNPDSLTGKKLLSHELVHVTGNKPFIQMEEDVFNTYDSVQAQMAIGKAGWEKLFYYFITKDRNYYIRSAFDENIKTNPDLLAFMQEKSMLPGTAGLTAIGFMRQNNREAFIDRTRISKTLSGTLTAIKTTVSAIPGRRDFKTYDQFCNDMDWLITNTAGDKFTLDGLIRIMEQVNSFLSHLDSMTAQLMKLDADAAAANSTLALTIHYNREDIERLMYRQMILLNKSFERPYFAESWSDYLFVRGFANINISLNKGVEINNQIDQLNRDIDRASTSFYEAGGTGALWAYIDRERNALLKLKKTENLYMPDDATFNSAQSQVRVIQCEFAIVSYALQCHLMITFINDSWQIFDKRSSEANKHKGQLQLLYDETIVYLNKPDTAIDKLVEKITDLASRANYREAVLFFNEFAGEEEDLRALISAILDFLVFITEVIILIGLSFVSAGVGSMVGSTLGWGLAGTALGEIGLVQIAALGAESFTFTVLNRTIEQMKSLIMTGNPDLSTSFGEDLTKNFLLFGSLKTVGKGFANIVSPARNPLLYSGGSFLAEVTTLTVFEAAWLAAQNGGLTPEQYNEVFSLESIGRTARFVFAMKMGMTGFHQHMKAMNGKVSNSLINSIQTYQDELMTDVQNSKKRTGIETESEYTSANKRSFNLYELYRQGYEDILKNTKETKDREDITKIIESIDQWQAGLENIDLAKKYDIRETGLSNFVSFRAKDKATIDRLGKDLTTTKIKGVVKTTGKFEKISGEVYQFTPDIPGAIPSFFYRINEVTFSPTLDNVAGTMFSKDAKESGKSSSKWLKDQFLESYRKSGGISDTEVAGKVEFNNIVIDAVARNWDPRTHYGGPERLPQESFDKAKAYFSAERVTLFKNDFAKRNQVFEVVNPEKFTNVMSMEQLRILSDSLSMNKERTLSSQYNYISSRITNPAEIKQATSVTDMIVVDLKNGKSEVLIWEAENIGSPLSLHLKDNVPLAREFNQTLGILTDVNVQQQLRSRMETTIATNSTTEVLPTVNKLIAGEPVNGRNKLGLLFAQSKTNDEIIAYERNKNILGADARTETIAETVYQTEIANLAVKLRSELKHPRYSDKKFADETRTGLKKLHAPSTPGGELVFDIAFERALVTDPMKSEAGMIHMDNPKTAPLATTFAGTTFYFHPDLNPYLNNQVKTNKAPLTRDAYIQLHQLHPEGISYSADGVPDLGKIAYRVNNGKPSAAADAEGRAIEVDLGDVNEFNELFLFRDAEGVSPIKLKHHDPHYLDDQRRASKAFANDIKLANKVMNKRWKAQDFGKWEQPEGSVWHFEPGTNKMLLVPEKTYAVFGYRPNERITNLEKAPGLSTAESKSEITTDNTTGTGNFPFADFNFDVTNPEVPFLQFKDGKKYTSWGGRYYEWDGMQWREIKDEQTINDLGNGSWKEMWSPKTLEKKYEKLYNSTKNNENGTAVDFAIQHGATNPIYPEYLELSNFLRGFRKTASYRKHRKAIEEIEKEPYTRGQEADYIQRITPKLRAFRKGIPENEIIIEKEQYSGKRGEDVPTVTIDPTDMRNDARDTLPAEEIGFMQNSISNATDQYFVLENAYDLSTGQLSVNTLGPVRVWKSRTTGRIWTLDHRRLTAYKLAGVKDIPIQWADVGEVLGDYSKMTTEPAQDGREIKINVYLDNAGKFSKTSTKKGIVWNLKESSPGNYLLFDTNGKGIKLEELKKYFNR